MVFPQNLDLAVYICVGRFWGLGIDKGVCYWIRVMLFRASDWIVWLAKVKASLRLYIVG